MFANAISKFVVQSTSHIWLFATPWTAARQASLSLTISQSLPKFMSIASDMMASSRLLLWRSLLLPPSIFPTIRDCSNEPAVHIRWTKPWSFSFSISPSREYSGLISLKIGLIFLLEIIKDSPNVSDCLEISQDMNFSFTDRSNTWWSSGLNRWTSPPLQPLHFSSPKLLWWLRWFSPLTPLSGFAPVHLFRARNLLRPPLGPLYY